jgi:hypothetical protein
LVSAADVFAAEPAAEVAVLAVDALAVPALAAPRPATRRAVLINVENLRSVARYRKFAADLSSASLGWL